MDGEDYPVAPQDTSRLDRAAGRFLAVASFVSLFFAIINLEAFVVGVANKSSNPNALAFYIVATSLLLPYGFTGYRGWRTSSRVALQVNALLACFLLVAVLVTSFVDWFSPTCDFMIWTFIECEDTLLRIAFDTLLVALIVLAILASRRVHTLKKTGKYVLPFSHNECEPPEPLAMDGESTESRRETIF